MYSVVSSAWNNYATRVSVRTVLNSAATNASGDGSANNTNTVHIVVPHCRLANLVKCRWADEVNQHLDTLRVVPLVPQRSAANDPATALDKLVVVVCYK